VGKPGHMAGGGGQEEIGRGDAAVAGVLTRSCLLTLGY
jgi:hypothetical protein